MKKNCFSLPKSPLFPVVILALFFANPGKGFSQSPDDANWSGSFGYRGLDGVIDAAHYDNSMIYYHDTLCIGGYITEFGQEVLSGIYKWDGKKLIPFRKNGFPRLNAQGIIYCLATDSPGMLYIGGKFDSVDGKAANNVAMWNGNQWLALGKGLRASSVQVLCCMGKKLFATGNFVVNDTCKCSDFAQWNGQDWEEIPNLPNMLIMPGNAVVKDSILFLTNYKGTEFWKWDGKIWTDLHTLFRRSMDIPRFPDSETIIFSLAVFQGDVYASGSFDSVEGIYAPRLARWDGNRWARVGSYEVIRRPNDWIRSIRSANGKLYVETGRDTSTSEGVFTSFIVNGDTLRNGAIWDGVKWTAPKNKFLDCGGQLCGRNDTLFMLKPGTFTLDSSSVFYTGFCRFVDSQAYSYVDSTQSGLSFDEITSIVNYQDKIYASFFTPIAAGDMDAESILVWDGSKWTNTDFYDTVKKTINELEYEKPRVRGLYAKRDSLIIFGSFDHFGRTKTNGVVLYDGKKWNPLYNSKMHAASFTAVAIDGFGKIYAHDDGIDIFQWIDTEWIRLPNAEDDSVTIHPESLMTASEDGLFATLASVQGNIQYIGHWDGKTWKIISNSTSRYTGGIIEVMKYDNGKLFMGGQFDSIGGVPMRNIGYWDGNSWQNMGKGIEFGRVENNPGIEDILCDGQDVYVTGAFSLADSIPAASIARWDGTKWYSLGTGLRSYLIELAPQYSYVPGLGVSMAIAGRRLYIGGRFNRAGGKLARHFTYYTIPEKNAVFQKKITTQIIPLTIFPDPANNYINVSLNASNIKILKAEIIDELGNVAKLFDLKNQEASASLRLDTHELPVGIYVVRIFTVGSILSQKFVIAK